MSKKTFSSGAILLCAIIWGTAFAFQRAGMEHIQPFYFSASRMLIGAAALSVIAVIGDKLKIKELSRKNLPLPTVAEKAAEKKLIIKGGAICGIVIFLAGNLQQVGIVGTSAGKTAFITTLYIILVPIMGIFLKHKTNVLVWVGVAFATGGLYFLCIKDGFTIEPTDLIVLVGAFFWALHILVTDHYAPQVNVTKLVRMQFVVGGTLSLIVALIFENFVLEAFMLALPGILYVGFMSTAIAFTLQALGQKHADPTVASILMSTEALFGAISGYLILGETFTSRELIGCVLMFIAIMLAQVPSKEERLANQALKAGKDA